MKNDNASTQHPFEIDKNYFFRTLTHYYTGKLIAVYENELVLANAAWIADTGRFNVAIKTGEFDEVEPFADHEVIIGRGMITDMIKVDWVLPTKVK